MKWLPIKGYESCYEVSDTGLVRSVDRYIFEKNTNIKRHIKGKILSCVSNKELQYFQVSLWKYNKGITYYVHRLLATAFIPNPHNLLEVNHIDGNRRNNHVSNLEWVSRTGNTQHAINTGLKQYSNRLSETEFLALLYDVINGGSYADISKIAPYKVPFLSVKLRGLAKKHDLEEKLNHSLKEQAAKRARENGKKKGKI